MIIASDERVNESFRLDETLAPHGCDLRLDGTVARLTCNTDEVDHALARADLIETIRTRVMAWTRLNQPLL